jgi:protocadherin-15
MYLQATDSGGKYSQTIVEVTVVPGPNTRGPVFENPVYEVQVSEGASINSTVTTITVRKFELSSYCMMSILYT